MKGLSADNSKGRSILLRIGVLSMFLLWTGVATTVQAQENMTVSAQGKAISEVFQIIEKQTHYVFLFEEEVKPELRKEIAINVKDKPIEYVMTELLKKRVFILKYPTDRCLCIKNSLSTFPNNPLK